jgi:hypothetical protein
MYRPSITCAKDWLAARVGLALAEQQSQCAGVKMNVRNYANKLNERPDSFDQGFAIYKIPGG